MKIFDYLKDYSSGSGQLMIFDNGSRTVIEKIEIYRHVINKYTNEFWTSKQRQALPIHEIAYRACFKPQLPNFFINMLSKENDTVFDPFSGRGTTVIEAGLLKRNIISNDISPLSEILTKPRFFIPDIKDVEKRLNEIQYYSNLSPLIDLTMFYHPKTLSEILCLKKYLTEKAETQSTDYIDRWIRMVATNRLTGHSPGFFSVYTLPPNQAVSGERQKKINSRLNQIPQYRDTKKLILKKTSELVNKITSKHIADLEKAGRQGLFLNEDARHIQEIKPESVQLTVTSPPFLDVVQYSDDNWLRNWFNDIDENSVEKKLSITRNIKEWCNIIEDVFRELYRITKREGWIAFEVGEVKKGKIKLDEFIVPLGIKAGFKCDGIIVNLQNFTKTSNIWGIKNNKSGTNTNRIVMFEKK